MVVSGRWRDCFYFQKSSGSSAASILAFCFGRYAPWSCPKNLSAVESELQNDSLTNGGLVGRRKQMCDASEAPNRKRQFLVFWGFIQVEGFVFPRWDSGALCAYLYAIYSVCRLFGLWPPCWRSLALKMLVAMPCGRRMRQTHFPEDSTLHSVFKEGTTRKNHQRWSAHTCNQ